MDFKCSGRQRFACFCFQLSFQSNKTFCLVPESRVRSRFIFDQVRTDDIRFRYPFAIDHVDFLKCRIACLLPEFLHREKTCIATHVQHVLLWARTFRYRQRAGQLAALFNPCLDFLEFWINRLSRILVIANDSHHRQHHDWSVEIAVLLRAFGCIPWINNVEFFGGNSCACVKGSCSRRQGFFVINILRFFCDYHGSGHFVVYKHCLIPSARQCFTLGHPLQWCSRTFDAIWYRYFSFLKSGN